jgi:2-methylisocitrate lyase-like PEP mutase family enzyme
MTAGLPSRRSLREILAAAELTIAPGCGDAMSARLIEAAGFEVAYISGAWTAALRGFPDVGVVSRGEMLDTARSIADSVTIPVVADIDTGFGGVAGLWRTIRDFERAGLDGVQLEDQAEPKKCGLMAGKVIVTPPEMAKRIRVAVDARRSSDFVIIARTDALANEGVDAVIERGHTYFDAGADALFVEAFQTVDEIHAVGDAFGGRPLVFNRTPRGFSPMVPMKELAGAGFRLAIFPMHLVLLAAGIGQKLLGDIRESGTAEAFEEIMMNIDEFFDLVGRQDYDALELSYEEVPQA